MKEIIFRFMIVYLFVLFSFKLIGKRQIGEMQTSELITAFFISELATFSITSKTHPIYFGLIPIALMVGIELLVSYSALKIPLIKRVFDFSPSVLIREGQVLEKELHRNRVTLDELFSLLRLNGYYDLAKVRFAILEPNGQLSVVPYAKNDSLSPQDLNVNVDETGFSVIIINDGRLNTRALDAIGKDIKWLNRILKREKISSMKDVFLLSSDYLGNCQIMKKNVDFIR